MLRYGWVAVAMVALMSGHMDQVGAGSKWWKRGCGGCSGCYAPATVGCGAPLASCAGPYGYGCGGCYAPSCGSPYGYGYQANYMMPSCYAPTCGQPAFYAPNCGGCYGPGYGYPGGGMITPTVGPYGSGYGAGYAGCGVRPEYNPYVYMPNPYVNTYGVGSPHYYPGSTPVGGYTPMSYSGYYNAPVAQSIPSIPALPPAEDIVW